MTPQHEEDDIDMPLLPRIPKALRPSRRAFRLLRKHERRASGCDEDKNPESTHRSTHQNPRSPVRPTLRKARNRVKKLWKRSKPSAAKDAEEEPYVECPDTPITAPSQSAQEIRQDPPPPSQKKSKKSRFLFALRTSRHNVTPEATTSNEVCSSDHNTAPLCSEETQPDSPITHNETESSAEEEADGESSFALLSLLVEQPLGMEPIVKNTASPKRKRKSKEEDPNIIGMEITFDPTSELLRSDDKPQCIKHTHLRKLQDFEYYKDSLLSPKSDEGSDTSSEEDVLGYHHLDNLVMSPWLRKVLLGETPNPEAREDLLESSLPEMAVHEEIEIVFSEMDESSERESSHSNSFVSKDSDDGEEDFEIAFFPCREVDEAQVADDHSNKSEPSCDDSSRYTDCMTSPATSVPVELPTDWFLPELAPGPADDVSEATPVYEWFHPDHQDVEPRKHHSMCDLFHPQEKLVATPTACGSTSFEVEETRSDDESSNKCFSPRDDFDRYKDCLSSPTSLPVELPTDWFLPELAPGPEDDVSEATPVYEWFHPDHQDVEPRKRHLISHIIYHKRNLLVGTSATTSESTSIEVDEPTSSSAEISTIDIMSIGSRASEAVQNLVDLCKV